MQENLQSYNKSTKRKEESVPAMNEASNLFVCLMGMGTTFVGLTCIIFLTMLMGKIMQAVAKPEPPKAAPAVSAAPAVPADGLTAEVKIAILAALQQEPGFDLGRVGAIEIRKI